MKKQGHPKYQETVLFIDTASGAVFPCGSSVHTTETQIADGTIPGTIKGQEYPIYRVPISSVSHPFFNKSKQFIDTEGRIDRFKKRYTDKAAESAKLASEGKNTLSKSTIKKKRPVKPVTKKKPPTN